MTQVGLLASILEESMMSRPRRTRNGTQPFELLYSSLAQSVERMTVNHDVAGSSPVRGAKKKDRFRTVFFLSNPKDWHVISPQVSM